MYWEPTDTAVKPKDERCRRCGGYGVIRVPERPSGPASVVEFDVAITATYKLIQVDCISCDGTGYKIAPVPERVDLYQGDKNIGSIPSSGPKLRKPRHPLVDIRPGDYTLIERDGAPAFKVNRMVGPGDYAELEGFRPAGWTDYK